MLSSLLMGDEWGFKHINIELESVRCLGHGEGRFPD